MNSSIRKRLLGCFAGVLFSAGAVAAGETETTVQHQFTTVAPIFMSGHAGDMAWIEGFSFSGTITLGGAQIGTVTGEARLWNPPMKFSEAYDQVQVKTVNTITGVGTYEVHAQGISLASSTTATTGDILTSWSGSITNGTGGLANLYGLAAGNGAANIFTQSASATEVLKYRFGY